MVLSYTTGHIYEFPYLQNISKEYESGIKSFIRIQRIDQLIAFDNYLLNH